MTEDDRVQCLLEMLIAGTDTSSMSLYYTIFALAENPTLRAQLCRGITDQLGRPAKRPAKHRIELERSVRAPSEGAQTVAIHPKTKFGPLTQFSTQVEEIPPLARTYKAWTTSSSAQWKVGLRVWPSLT